MCVLSNGYIKGLKRTPGSNKIAGILEAFPRLNPNWLLAGEGSFLMFSAFLLSSGK